MPSKQRRDQRRHPLRGRLGLGEQLLDFADLGADEIAVDRGDEVVHRRLVVGDQAGCHPRTLRYGAQCQRAETLLSRQQVAAARISAERSAGDLRVRTFVEVLDI